MYIFCHSTVMLLSTSVPVVPVAVSVTIALTILLVAAAFILGVLTMLRIRCCHNRKKNGMYLLGS